MKFMRSNQGTCLNQRPLVVPRRPRAQGRADRRQLDHAGRRAGARPERALRLHELGGLQLRGRDHHLREPGARRQVHLDPHREARSRSARHQAGPRRDHARHPERRRREPERPRRGRHHPHRRRGPRRRHPRRQDHAEGRDRADGGREAAARDLRREGARGEGHQPARAARRARQGDRRQGLQPRRTTRTCRPA